MGGRDWINLERMRRAVIVEVSGEQGNVAERKILGAGRRLVDWVELLKGLDLETLVFFQTDVGQLLLENVNFSD